MVAVRGVYCLCKDKKKSYKNEQAENTFSLQKNDHVHAQYLSGGKRLFQQATQLCGLERNLSFLALGSDILTP